MKYLIMECHPGYAVALDSDGRFIKVANMRYQVGQTVDHIIEFSDIDTSTSDNIIYDAEFKEDNSDIKLRETNSDSEFKEADSDIEQKSEHSKVVGIFSYLKKKKRMSKMLTSAACIGLVALNSWYFVFMTYATVEVNINPDVLIYVNRLNYVKNIKALNDDGTAILENYSYLGKKLDTVSKELTRTANDKGYLENNNDIDIIVRSTHSKWADKNGTKLTDDINTYLGELSKSDIKLTYKYVDTDKLDDLSDKLDDPEDDLDDLDDLQESTMKELDDTSDDTSDELNEALEESSEELKESEDDRDDEHDDDRDDDHDDKHDKSDDRDDKQDDDDDKQDDGDDKSDDDDDKSDDPDDRQDDDSDKPNYNKDNLDDDNYDIKDYNNKVESSSEAAEEASEQAAELAEEHREQLSESISESIEESLEQAEELAEEQAEEHKEYISESISESIEEALDQAEDAREEAEHDNSSDD